MENILDNPYRDIFTAVGQKYGYDPEFLAAIAKIESNFNPNAVSKAGAQGMMQFMPGTAQQVGLANPNDPAQSIEAAAKYFDYIKSRGITDPYQMAAAYNAGPGAVQKYNGIPPYEETQGYVQKLKGILPNLSGAESQPAVLQNLNTPQAGIDLSQFSRPTDRKLTGAEKAAAFLGILGSLGGMVASTAAPFKGVSGDPGAAATKSGMSLLSSLIGKQDERKEEQKFFDAVLNSNLDVEKKANILSFAQQGLSEQAAKLFNDAIATQNNIEQTIATNTDPRILASKKLMDEEKRKAEMADFKAKEDYKQVLGDERKKVKLEQLNGLLALGDKVSDAQKNEIAVLREELGINQKQNDPYTAILKEQQIAAKYENIPDVKRAKVVGSFAQRVDAVWEDYQNNKNNNLSKNALDNTLVTSFAKMLDEMTGVKEAEFNKIASNIPLRNKVNGWLQAQQTGGLTLTDADREDLLRGIRTMNRSANKLVKENHYTPLVDKLKKSGLDDSLITMPYEYKAPEKTTESQPGQQINNQEFIDLMKQKGAKSLRVVP